MFEVRESSYYNYNVLEIYDKVNFRNFRVNIPIEIKVNNCQYYVRDILYKKILNNEYTYNYNSSVYNGLTLNCNIIDKNKNITNVIISCEEIDIDIDKETDKISNDNDLKRIITILNNQIFILENKVKDLEDRLERYENIE